MSIDKAVWIACDGDDCDQQHPSDLSCSTAAEARRLAHRAGWRRLTASQACESGDFCPDCWEQLQEVRNDGQA